MPHARQGSRGARIAMIACRSCRRTDHRAATRICRDCADAMRAERSEAPQRMCRVHRCGTVEDRPRLRAGGDAGPEWGGAGCPTSRPSPRATWVAELATGKAWPGTSSAWGRNPGV